MLEVYKCEWCQCSWWSSQYQYTLLLLVHVFLLTHSLSHVGPAYSRNSPLSPASHTHTHTHIVAHVLSPPRVFWLRSSTPQPPLLHPSSKPTTHMHTHRSARHSSLTPDFMHTQVSPIKSLKQSIRTQGSQSLTSLTVKLGAMFGFLVTFRSVFSPPDSFTSPDSVCQSRSFSDSHMPVNLTQ